MVHFSYLLRSWIGMSVSDLYWKYLFVSFYLLDKMEAIIRQANFVGDMGSHVSH